MVSRLLLTMAILGLAGPALGQPRCSKPYAPAVTPNAKTSAKDMMVMRGDVTAFIAAVDVYQTCLSRMPPSLNREALLAASQAEKARVGKEFNAYVRVFKASNPS